MDPPLQPLMLQEHWIEPYIEAHKWYLFHTESVKKVYEDQRNNWTQSPWTLDSPTPYQTESRDGCLLEKSRRRADGACHFASEDWRHGRDLSLNGKRVFTIIIIQSFTWEMLSLITRFVCTLFDFYYCEVQGTVGLHAPSGGASIHVQVNLEMSGAIQMLIIN